MAQPYLRCKCYDLLQLYTLLHLLCVLDDVGGVRIPYLCTPFQCMNIGELLHYLFRTLVLDLLDCFSPSWGCLEFHLICNLWILNKVLFPLNIHHWICAFDFTRILRNAQLFQELILYQPSKFFLPISAIDANGEEVPEGLREFGFYAFVAFAFNALCILACLSCKVAIFII